MPPDTDPDDRPNESLDEPRLYIGPGGSPEDRASPLLNKARRRVHLQDEHNKESARLARRLFVAMILIALLGVVFYIVLPYFGLRLPPFVPILCYISILVGAILTLRDEINGNGRDHE